MFDLEKAVAEWRRRMIANGLRDGATLDELESHLRLDMEQQMQSGVNLSQTFEAAVARIGRADVLKREFAKTKGFRGGINRILAVLWFAGCLLSFNTVCRQPLSYAAGTPSNMLYGSAVFIYAAGVLGSVFLFRGAKWGRSIVRMLALLMAIACVAQLLDFRRSAGWLLWCGIVAIFSVVSIWLLHARDDGRPKRTTQ